MDGGDPGDLKVTGRAPADLAEAEPALPTSARCRALRRRLLRWYAEAQRDMPWRGESDPYRIWLSEVSIAVSGQPRFDRGSQPLVTVALSNS